MTASISVAPPNSLLLVAEAPTSTGPKGTRAASGIAATRSCIGVGCLMFLDGETHVTLGLPHRKVDRPAFDGYLDTPHRKVAVWTIEWDKLLETSVPTTRTRIRIWTNHPTEPDDIYIGIGEDA